MKFRFYALKLTAICVLVFVLQILIVGFTEFFLLNQNSTFEIWRFFTAMFLHGSLAHLVFNSIALALFGSILEATVGSRKFLMFFLLSGIFANIVAVNFYPSSLGASGAIYGILGAVAVLRPLMIVWAFGMPMPMIVAGILWAAGDVLGLFMPSNIGHIAHLSGMFLGILMAFSIKRNPKYARKNRVVRLSDEKIRKWEDNYLK